MEHLDTKQLVSVSGFLFSLTTKKRIFAFDLGKETWDFSELPKPLSTDYELNDMHLVEYKGMHLVEYKGRLAFFCKTKERCTDLWVVEDCVQKKTSWSMIKKLGLETITREHHTRDISYVALYDRSSTSKAVKVENLSLGMDEIFRIELDDKVVNLSSNTKSRAYNHSRSSSPTMTRRAKISTRHHSELLSTMSSRLTCEAYSN
ncbi:F-box associated domain, type [Trema orientale]|uniref:F-box associated domain, type n=1 Tax=Trema orientale TaxID=63057 RepID=A0A2P5EFY7_TREOI|nr:F-box associated domain, type [Trema orientale]